MNVSQLNESELMVLRNRSMDIATVIPHNSAAYQIVMRIYMAAGVEFMTRLYTDCHTLPM